jgi:hypothetical protein
MLPNNLTPEDVLSALQRDATKRTRQSLDLINTLCKEQYEAGNLDFSVATIGRLSAARGGPSTQAIRNATGEHYRALLKAWANHVAGAARKPAVRPEPGVADDVLAMISDPSVRAVVGSFLAENRKLRAENTLLKTQTQVVIDRRPSSAMSTPTSPSGVQVLPAMSMLLPLEVDALRHALSDELLTKMGWSVDAKTGRVSKNGHAVFRAGFATAIKKVLNAV